jgi:hypothetical protein
MRLVFSNHARVRMRMRGITESDALTCLDDAHTRIVGTTSTTYMGNVEGRTLKVVVATDRDSDTEKYIITTVWRGDDGSQPPVLA